MTDLGACGVEKWLLKCCAKIVRKPKWERNGSGHNYSQILQILSRIYYILEIRFTRMRSLSRIQPAS